MFAYQASHLWSHRFLSFLGTYVWSATLPIDVILVQIPLSSEGRKEILEYVEQVELSLRAAYS